MSVLGLILIALFEGKICWENCFYVFLGAIVLDFLKKDMKPELNFTYYDRVRGSSTEVGSAEWRADPCRIGSPANHLRNLERNSRYD